MLAQLQTLKKWDAMLATTERFHPKTGLLEVCLAPKRPEG
jgi:hypothetical protein